MRLGKRRRGRLREEGGWAWWLLSDSQERFSPSIGVLKAPWIINGLSLRSHPPSSSSFSSCHCAPFFLFSSLPLHLILSPSSLHLHLSSLLCGFSSISSPPHCLTFCLHSPKFIFALFHSIPASLSSTPCFPSLLIHLCLLSSSVFHLFLSFQSLLPSHPHPLSLEFIAALVHLFIFLFVSSFQYLPPSHLPARLLILSLSLLAFTSVVHLYSPPHPTFHCHWTTFRSSFVHLFICHIPNGFGGNSG